MKPGDMRYIARVEVLERHADGSMRKFTRTQVVDAGMTVGELFTWRNKKVHDPLNGEFASIEVVLTADDGIDEY